MQRRGPHASLLAAAFIGLTASAAVGGCGDEVQFPHEDDVDPVEGQTTPAPAGIRRVLARQYVASVRLIFGDDAAAAANPPVDVPLHGLSSIGAAEVAMPVADVEQYEGSGMAIGRAFAEDDSALGTRFPCASGDTDRVCFEGLVENAGRLAWRRTLTDDEIAEVTDIAMEAVASYPASSDAFLHGIEYAVSALLNAPEFLYIVELGEPDAEDPAKRPLTQAELVTRASFFLTDTTPDEAALDLAESGGLSGDDALRSLATELVQRDSARAALSELWNEAYQIGMLPETSKDAATHPTWNADVAAALKEGTLAFINDIIWDQNADSRDLMRGDFAYVNIYSAPLFGLTAGGQSLQRVNLPEGQPRRGLMAQPGILALQADPFRTSPTRRGLFIQRALRCFEIAPPPPGVVTEIPEVDPGDPKTVKELLLEVHRAQPSCAACHDYMDPIGLAYEQFDAIGKYRETDENGLTIDPTGEFGPIGTFADAAELGELLAADPKVPACLLRTVFRNSMGHLETEGEDAAIVALDAAFEEKGFRVQDLLVEIVASPAFRLVGEPK